MCWCAVKKLHTHSLQGTAKTNCTQICFFACNLLLLCFVTFVNIRTGYVHSTRLQSRHHTIGNRASPPVASRVWNRGRAYRPTSRAASSLSSLKRQLKTALFARSFASIWQPQFAIFELRSGPLNCTFVQCPRPLLTLRNLHHARLLIIIIILIILISDVCLLADLKLLVKFFRNHIAIANTLDMDT